MPTTPIDEATSVTANGRRATVESAATDVELCCPGCGGFIAAIELPTHRMEHDCTIHVRLHCKRCRKRSRRRITFGTGRPA